jgi:hypothetical protein
VPGAIGGDADEEEETGKGSTSCRAEPEYEVKFQEEVPDLDAVGGVA